MTKENELSHIKEKIEISRQREIIGIILVICGLILFSIGYYYTTQFFLGLFVVLTSIGGPISIYYERRYYSLKLELERKSKVEVFY